MARWRKLGVIAGGGGLPLRVAAACSGRGENVFVIGLDGAADADFSNYEAATCAIGEAGRMLRLIKEAGCDAVVFAGLVKRPDFRSLRADWRGAALLPKVLAAAARGDGAILDVLVETIEAEGLFVVGAEEVMSELSALAGPLGEFAPSEGDFDDIAKAAAIIDALGAFDIGQGAVVAGGLVLAVEAAEGTDAMLARCEALYETGVEKGRAGVLVKRPKPGQELRVDLPVIGPTTIERAAAAGLAGVAVEAGLALVIDRDEVRRRADEAGLFVYGFRSEEVKPS